MGSTQRLHDEDGAAPADGSSARRRLSITITPRTLWLAAGISVAILVGIVLITQAAGTLIALLLAVILGEAIRPLVARLQRYRIPGPLAVLLIYVVALVIAGFLIWLLLNPLIQEVNSFSNNLPAYLGQLQRQANDIGRQLRAQGALSQIIDTLSRSLASVAQQAIPRLLTVPVGFLTGVFGLFINLVVVLTMTLFWLMASERLKPFVVGLFPDDSQDRAAGVLTEIGHGFGGYIRGTLISMVIIGSLSAAGLALLGVPYALLLGILAGLTELLPYLGPWISGTVAVLVALITVDPVKAIEVIVLFLLIQEIEGNVIQPLVMSRAVNVDPLLVIVSVLIGIDLLGIIGAILAVPIAAAAQILVVRVLAPAIRRTPAAPATSESAPTAMAAEPVEPSTPRVGSTRPPSGEDTISN
jgi:predicted PurR-regulated permease PerM